MKDQRSCNCVSIFFPHSLNIPIHKKTHRIQVMNVWTSQLLHAYFKYSTTIHRRWICGELNFDLNAERIAGEWINI